MPRPELGDLPLEVFENVLSRLDLDEVRTLRLTGNAVAGKAAHFYYTALFRRKTICLTAPKQIEDFVRKTEPGETGCYVQHLTLRIRASRKKRLCDAECLAIAEHLAKALVKLRRLQCLTLAVECLEKAEMRPNAGGGQYQIMRRTATWQQIFKEAEQTFAIACRALQISGLRVDEFDAFGDIRACSLTCNHIRTALDWDPSVSFQGLKRLSLSLSGHHGGDRDVARNIGDICSLLRMCPVLETLEVHWFHLRDEDREGERRFFDHVADTVQLPRLRRLSIKGIGVCADALVQFFSNSPLLAELIMDNITLHTGSYSTVFASITPRLNYLNLDNLWAERLMCFDAPGQPHFPSSGRGKKGPNHLVREGAQARRPVKFRTHNGRSLGSPQVMNWNRRLTANYGPP